MLSSSSAKLFKNRKIALKLPTLLPSSTQRTYFTFMDRIKQKINIPMRHIRSFMQPDQKYYQSSLPQSPYRLYGNSNMNFTAYLTHNAYDMNLWHEMENTVHSQFGTVDNPVIIFTSDSTWRTVICMGPGSQEDAYTHERMYYIVRQGPLHRCHLCGQVFKLVRLKNQYSEINDYYHHMFSKIDRYEIRQQDLTMGMTSVFSDRPQILAQSSQTSQVFVQINSDEHDHLMIDPAYRLEKTMEAHERYLAMKQAERVVKVQLKSRGGAQERKIPFNRELFDTWWKVEKSIRKFDRIYNQIEKFDGRKLIDPENHERREKRMISRKRQRWVTNYPYFFGGLTEQEQMYRDYYETDIEADSGLNQRREDALDEIQMVETGDFDLKKFDFVQTALVNEKQEQIMDVVSKLLFKYKYRRANDGNQKFTSRQKRVISRFLQRAEKRSPQIQQNLAKLLDQNELNENIGVMITNPERAQQFKAKTDSDVIREYMLEQSLLQYKDYYESDQEEQKMFELVDNLSNRDRIRMIEIFQDYTRPDLSSDGKKVALIPKRQYNPQLSLLKNLQLDLFDFRDRVKPLAGDLSLMDEVSKYQRVKANSVDTQISKLNPSGGDGDDK